MLLLAAPSPYGLKVLLLSLLWCSENVEQLQSMHCSGPTIRGLIPTQYL